MSKQLNVSFKLLAFAVLLCFVAGCASASTPTPLKPSLVGTWMTTITEEEAPTFVGQGEITFADNGRILVFNPGVRMPTDMGAYTVTQDQFFLTDERSECVKIGFPTATYKWSVENDTLTLTAIDDRCYSRRKPIERAWSRGKIVVTPGPTLKPMLK